MDPPFETHLGEAARAIWNCSRPDQPCSSFEVLIQLDNGQAWKPLRVRRIADGEDNENTIQ
jgi:hypothetical protein